MLKDNIVLVADGGSVTIGRRLAFYSYGKFDVIIPDDREQQETDDRIENGYIARNPGTVMGRFDFGFIRADATINLQSQTSDLELAIDSTNARSEGDVYLERDITPPGFGGAVPGVDFEVDDIVRVRMWRNFLRLPVTAIDYIASTSDGPRDSRVHVGGQVISDAEARRRNNNEILLQLNNEKRQRLKDTSAIRETASKAKQNSEIALRAATDADGVIQGHVETAWEHTVQAGKYSDAASEASDRATAASEEVAKQRPIIEKYAQDAETYSMNASKHSLNARLYTDSAREASEQSAAYSEQSHVWSQESHTWSVKSQEASTASAQASQAASGYSAAAETYSKAAKAASDKVAELQPTIAADAQAAKTASVTANGFSTSAKNASDAASKASSAATTAQGLSEEAMRQAEIFRNDAETNRSLAEQQRQAAETARSKSFGAMVSASVSMGVAEQARSEAEEQRRQAEAARSEAETNRSLAEQQRRAAEAARDAAEDGRDRAERFRNEAERFRNEAETRRGLAEGEREKAETARSKSFGAMVSASVSMGVAEQARSEAEQQRQAAEGERKAAEVQRGLAEKQREQAEVARDEAEKKRVAADNARRDAEAARDRAIESLEDSMLVANNAIYWQEIRRTRVYSKYSVKTVESYDDLMTATPVDSERNMQLDFPGTWGGRVQIQSRMVDAWGGNSRVDFAEYNVGPGQRSYKVTPEVSNYGVNKIHFIVEQWFPNRPLEFVLVPNGEGRWETPPYDTGYQAGVLWPKNDKGWFPLAVSLLWVRGAGYKANRPVIVSDSSGKKRTYAAGTTLPVTETRTLSGVSVNVTTVWPAGDGTRPIQFIEQI
ncbi:hypothetical protein [Corynebacterium phoceense]|uniref:hypothetical protein n=1 Tax=Corynebacterium phoceense TaxID=1686286 RepID=UPI00211C70A4|nr:hypothetical protein [Corynebacterium phoceense]MCQ9345853.1 hypothetical protein [Corynebacterium phoceense]